MSRKDNVRPAVLRRDRVIVLAALAVLVILAWLYLLFAANSMRENSPPTQTMSGDSMAAMLSPRLALSAPSHWVFVYVMWTVMMVGMMTPSAAPMVLTYGMVARKAESMGKPLAATAWFVGGYLLAWALFALLATIGQWALERLALLTPAMVSASAPLGALVLILAGIYQWTPLKSACLEHCRSPISFVQRHGGFRSSAGGSLKLGLLHGAFCIGCCWALMALLFVGGVMNVLWIAALTAIALAEKLLPFGRWVARIAGAGAIAAGICVLAAS